MTSRRYALVFALALQAFSASAEDLTAAKQADIRKLMDITGSSSLAVQFASATSQNIFQALKAARPDIPDRALQVMDRELMGMFAEKMDGPGGLMEKLVPVYARHFTHAEIRELIAFYGTPIGKKAVATLPKVVSESMLVGQQWGASLAPEIERRIHEALTRENLLPVPR